uniref:Sec-independent protein translocase component TatC n=1 Tax=Trichogloeopsis pedicellata TaxID=1495610 RepID=A0A1G4P0J5_9FLOR|nr:Sec-independent protein translocase component TatC [Trichogloeopsis pedicellata]SCW24421.1 Sec-independent protein translocase component TatC [Trichogloeopsis pedicellata]
MNKNTYKNDKEMSISEHLHELRQRVLITLLLFGISTLSSFCLLKKLTLFLQYPAHGVKFLQLAPGEYFFVSVKIAFYTGTLLSLPIAIYQIIMFILPGLTGTEATVIVPSLLGSICLFFGGILFGYTVLAPAALTFFISYGADIIEPIWSFEQYFDFILLLLISTGLAFQVPIIQILLGYLNIVSSKQMISAWKYIIVIATILGAVLTPSTDPFTQILMSFAILTLYFSGIGILIILKK